jgi:hypothetical protein
MSGAVGGGGVNAVGGGQIAGLGVNNPNIPNQAEPGVDLKKHRKRSPILFKDLRRRKPVTESYLIEEVFAGNTVFTVDNDRFHACRMGKKKYARWVKYVGDDEIGKRIKAFGYKYPHKPIILKNGSHGGMLYLRYPNAQR